MIYIATFFSHFGAIRFKRLCDGEGFPAKVMPVPRRLSSSCGTCVRFETNAERLPEPTEEMEQIARKEDENYHVIWKA